MLSRRTQKRFEPTVDERREGQIEILPVWHAAQLGQLQHHAALSLEHGIVHGVEVGFVDPLDPIGQLWVVAHGIGDHQLSNVIREHPLAGQTELFEPIQQRVQCRHPPVGEPDRGVRQLRLGGGLRHCPHGGLVMARSLGRHCHSWKH